MSVSDLSPTQWMVVDVTLIVLAILISVVAIYYGTRRAQQHLAAEYESSLLSSDEQRVLNGICPDCLEMELHAGPQGGSSTNFACFSCMHRFNAMFVPGQVLFFERIGRLEKDDIKLFRVENLVHDGDYVYGL